MSTKEEESKTEVPAVADYKDTVIFLASPSKKEDLVEWMKVKRLQYAKELAIVADENLADTILADYQLSTLNIEKCAKVSMGGDIILANRILQDGITGVVFFVDVSLSSVEQADLNLLLRACDIAGVPMALNPQTADIMMRGIASTTRAYLIFNPVAGQRDPQEDLREIRKALEPHLILTVIYTQPDVEAADQARDVIRIIKASYTSDYESNSVIIASGGDGTVSAIGGATIGSGIPFGVIPRGTANAFSVALGIPTDVEGACRNIVEGNVRTVDGAMANETPMVLLAGLGFEAGMVQNASRELKDKIGTLAYVLGGAKTVIDQAPFECKLTFDGVEQEEIQASAVTVANVAPPTSVMAQGFGGCVPDDGLLEVTISTATDMQGRLDHMANLLTAAIVQKETQNVGILCARVKEAKLVCDPPQTVVIDGEMLEMNPITFKILPGALKVLAPPADQVKFTKSAHN